MFVCDLTIGFEEAREFKLATKSFLRMREWQDIKMNIYV